MGSVSKSCFYLGHNLMTSVLNKHLFCKRSEGAHDAWQGYEEQLRVMGRQSEHVWRMGTNTSLQSDIITADGGWRALAEITRRKTKNKSS